MKNITLLLLLSASVVSANELDTNRQLKKNVKAKQKQLLEQQEENKKLKKETAVITETADKIAAIKRNSIKKPNEVIYANPLDGSRKIELYSSSNKTPFANYVDSSLLIENNDPKEKRNVCGKWIKVPEGKKLKFSIWVKAENVKNTRIKFGLMIKGDNGKINWPAANIGNGTFDWQQASFTTSVPLGVKNCLLMYGLEKGTGKVYFKDYKVEVVN